MKYEELFKFLGLPRIFEVELVLKLLQKKKQDDNRLEYLKNEAVSPVLEIEIF